MPVDDTDVFIHLKSDSVKSCTRFRWSFNRDWYLRSICWMQVTIWPAEASTGSTAESIGDRQTSERIQVECSQRRSWTAKSSLFQSSLFTSRTNHAVKLFTIRRVANEPSKSTLFYKVLLCETAERINRSVKLGKCLASLSNKRFSGVISTTEDTSISRRLFNSLVWLISYVGAINS